MDTQARMETGRRTHILVVDDDREVRKLLATYLEDHGYRATAVADGAGMRRVLDDAPVDLLVLDVMMPGDNGIMLSHAVRATSQVPIIMLSALDDDEERIAGIDSGADDYLVKPFNPRELLGRIRAVLRRASRVRPALVHKGYRFGDWRLDTVSRTLSHSRGEIKDLTGAEYRLLVVLLTHPMQVLSRAQVTELLRGRDIEPFDRSIDTQISRLRQLLEDDASAPRLIRTIYGKGYVLTTEVEAE